MKLALWKNHSRGEILYRSPVKNDVRVYRSYRRILESKNVPAAAAAPTTSGKLFSTNSTALAVVSWILYSTLFTVSAVSISTFVKTSSPISRSVGFRNFSKIRVKLLQWRRFFRRVQSPARRSYHLILGM